MGVLWVLTDDSADLMSDIKPPPLAAVPKKDPATLMLTGDLRVVHAHNAGEHSINERTPRSRQESMCNTSLHIIVLRHKIRVLITACDINTPHIGPRCLDGIKRRKSVKSWWLLLRGSRYCDRTKAR